MSELRVVAERTIGAPATLVYRLIADFDRHHPRFLPPAFSDFQVEQGGVGAGTVHSFKMTTGGRTRSFRMRVAEPDPGRVLTESEMGSSMVTTWIVTPQGPGCRVRLETRWQGRVGSVGCSSGCSRRGCCGGCTPRSWSGWTATPARPCPAERSAAQAPVRATPSSGVTTTILTESLFEKIHVSAHADTGDPAETIAVQEPGRRSQAGDGPGVMWVNACARDTAGCKVVELLVAGRRGGTVRWLLAVATVAAMQLWAGGPVWAEQPLRVDDQVTDRIGALAGEVARVREALDRLREANGTQLFVVYVSSFDGMDGQQWSDETARRSQLGDRDVLLAVAVDDRAYGYSVPGDFPLSDSELADLAVQEVEPRLAAGDWAGAAVAMADGLRTADGGGGDGGGGLPVGALLVGAGIVGGGALLLSRRRRARDAAVGAGSAPAVPEPAAAPSEHPVTPTRELLQQANTALIEVDNAVQTSEQELGFAEASFGEKAVTGFRQALEQARGELRQAFALRQRLDDAEPEDEQTVRGMLTEILQLCRSADERLDAQAEAFDRLRDLERTLPEVLAALGPRAHEVQARLPQEEQRLEALRGRYAAAALAPVTDNVEQARQRLNAAQGELTAARSALDAGRPGDAVVSTRAAEDAVAQASTLLDGIVRLESDLLEAGARMEAARAETDKDLAEARAMLASGNAPDPAGLRQLIDKAEAALTAAETALRPWPGTLPDPLAALRLVDEADVALDAALAAARDEQARRQRSAAILDQALLAARSSVAAASGFIATRRGAVGTGARTRLVEAQRRLQKATALSEQDPTQALQEAQHADQLAQAALQVAQSDVDQWSTPYRGDRFLEIASLVLGGILLGGGGSGESGGGFGGRSPGSFGGSGSGGRRGGGGRF